MVLRALSRGLAAFVLTAFVSACALADDDKAAPASNRRFGDSIGLNVKFVQGQPLGELTSLTELKVRWVRENIWWSDIEPAPGRYVGFSSNLKRQLAFYRKHDIGFVALLGIGNGRAYPATADDPKRPFNAEAFGRFALAVAHMLRSEGVRFVLELGNEPHNSGLPKAFGGAWNGKAPSPWVDQYVRMVAEAVRQVKAFDPSIKLLSDDDMWIVHYWFLQAGLPRELDGFAIHPYAEFPETTAVAHDTDWTQPFQVVDRDRSFESAVRRLRDAGREKLGRTPEVWITEWGWPVGPGPFKKFVSEETLAAYLPRAFVLAAAAGTEVLCWFSSQDTVDGPMGLIDNKGRRRPGYHAFKTMSEQLSDYVLIGPVVGPGGKGVHAYLFQGHDDQKLVAWTSDATEQFVRLPANSAVDVMGRAISIVPAPQSTTVSIGTAPVYLRGNWDAPTLRQAFGLEPAP